MRSNVPRRIKKLVRLNYRKARRHRKRSSWLFREGFFPDSRNELKYALLLEREAEDLLERWG